MNDTLTAEEILTIRALLKGRALDLAVTDDGWTLYVSAAPDARESATADANGWAKICEGKL